MRVVIVARSGHDELVALKPSIMMMKVFNGRDDLGPGVAGEVGSRPPLSR